MKSDKRMVGERGFVSIFTTLMLMGIIGLLMLGFTYATNQARRRTLDDLLSTRAFYAAESGINDAINALKTTPTLNKSACTTGGSFTYAVDGASGLTYTCLLIRSTVNEYENDYVPIAGMGEPVVVPLNSSATITDLLVEWDSSSGNTTGINGSGYVSSSPHLSPAGAWGSDVGMIRLDLIPTDSIGNQGNMINNSYTQFLYPSTNIAAAAPGGIYGILNGPTYQGGTALGPCVTTVPAPEYRCSATLRIMNLGGAPVTRTSYYMRLQSYYNSVKVRVTPKNGLTNVTLTGLQAIIDSTGRSNDVYRRVEVRVPITVIEGFHLPYAVGAADSICKRYISAPPDGSGAGGTIVSAPSEITDGSCSIQ